MRIDKYYHLYGRKDDVVFEEVPNPEPHWIPVTERLPEYGVAVLTINADGEYEINHLVDEDDAEWFYDGAIAWMPLPEAYKGEE